MAVFSCLRALRAGWPGDLLFIRTRRDGIKRELNVHAALRRVLREDSVDCAVRNLTKGSLTVVESIVEPAESARAGYLECCGDVTWNCASDELLIRHSSSRGIDI